MAKRQTSQIPVHQLIGYYGIGSIYELRSHWNERQSGLHSVMVAGMDFWDSKQLDSIQDPILEHILGVTRLLSPPIDADEERPRAEVPVVRFPKWLVCDRCQRLGRVPDQFNDEHFSGPRCHACRGRGMPARLVVACQPQENDDVGQAGHIDDFPWEYWAHHGPSCENPQLQLRVLPGTSSLRGLVVVCLNPKCVEQKMERSLGDALMPEVLSHWHCSGKRPWLDDEERGCSRPVRALFRHASNVYFPDVVSAVSIPPFSTELYQQLQRHDARIIRGIRRDRERNRTIDWDRILEDLRDEDDRWIRPFTDQQVVSALEELSDVGDITVPGYRMKERRALLAGYPESPKALFVADPWPDEDIPPSLGSIVSHIVQVQRLREVRVLRGFRRISPNSSSAPLGSYRTDANWLPAVELHGEGIYLEWNREALEAWARQPEVIERVNAVAAAADPHVQDHAQPVAMLLHTLSHLLIKQLALDSGYGLGALRERLYVQNEHGEWAAGGLIYTASTASGGTLGGLVRQGTPERIARLLNSAYDEARWCSSDPLCIEHRELVDNELNLAACHACCLISETACEWSNQFLDRALVVGDLENPAMGFLTRRFS